MRIIDLRVLDVRFPTSRGQHGSDAMHAEPDYSATYVTLSTDSSLEGHGLTFTIGRGNEVCCVAVEALKPLVVGRDLDEIIAAFADFWRELTSEQQLRWIGPEKGAIHLATAAVVNAIWDLWAKREDKPLWELICAMTPEQIVRCIDFRYITDAITPDEAIALLQDRLSTRAERREQMVRSGFPAYTTSVGWLGYSDDRIRKLCTRALAMGWNDFKIKVGGDIRDDRRRAAIVREQIGPQRRLMIDANQQWGVDEAIDYMQQLAEFEPYWIEEPTSPDDVLGHARIRNAIEPIGVATGEQCANRVLFKQLITSGAITHCQLDSCRLGGVNEVLAVMLLAAKYGVPVCPHAGGVGLCEYVQHLIMIDYICIGASLKNCFAEYVDLLHEHFESPCNIRNGHYMPPTTAGYGVTMIPSSLAAHRYPDGSFWQSRGKAERVSEGSDRQ